MTFEIQGALPGNNPLYRGRIENLAMLLELCQNPGQLFGLVYGGPRSGKTSLINRLLATLPPDVSGQSIYLRGIPDKSLSGVLAAIVRQAYQLLTPQNAPPVQIVDGLGEALYRAAQQTDSRVAVLIIHGLSAIARDVRWELADQLCGLYYARENRHALNRLQIILCGGLELYNLAEKDLNSPLEGVCKAIYLSDLAEVEAIDLVSTTLQQAGLPMQEAETWGQLVYQQCGGHPYLTQLFGAYILSSGIAEVANHREFIDQATEAVLQQDRMFKALRGMLDEYALGDAARRLVAGQARSDSQTIQLRVLGLVKETSLYWLPQNRVFGTALKHWFLPNQSAASVVDVPHPAIVSTAKRKQADIGIVIALTEEFRYLTSLITSPLTSEEDDETDVVFYRFDQGGYRCVAVLVGEMNPGPTQHVTGRLLSNFQLEAVALIGIAGSLDKDVLLGDVVVASTVIGWLEGGKTAEGSTKENFNLVPAGQPFDTGEFRTLFQNIEFQHLAEFQRWQSRGAERRDDLGNDGYTLLGAKKMRTYPQIITGKIASGSLVVGAEAVKRELKQHNRDLKAVEMESLGMISAIRGLKKNLQPQALILRGISDFADERKSNLDEQTENKVRRMAMVNAIDLLWVAIDLGFLPRADNR